jgi:alpha-amylase
MDRTRLVMVLHGHQPWGTPEAELARASDRCYAPVLAAVGRHPDIHLGLHFSGLVLEWFEDQRPDLFDSIASLAAAGQVELLGGGMYEPVLAALPEGDAWAQLELMSEWLADRFGRRPTGVWLAERVWEPQLAGLLARQGIEYTLVDDHLFRRAGLTPGEIPGWWQTEQAGDRLALWPIDRRLRYAVPFDPVERVIGDLQRRLADAANPVLVYADDVEKLGLWPGTEALIAADGWWDGWLDGLAAAADLTVCSPAEALAATPTRGRIYLPGGTYPELERGLLPPAAETEADTGSAGLGPAPPFKSVLLRWPEANRLYQKMLSVSRKLEDALEDDDPWEEAHEEARYALFRGQCHNAYWAGLFGGLMRPELRFATYRALLQAETTLDQRSQGEEDWIASDEADLDGDGHDEIMLEQSQLNAIFCPGRGGTVIGLDFRPAAVNLVDVMTRRPAADSAIAFEAPEPARDGSEPPLQVAADRFERACLLDRFPAPHTTLEELQQATYEEQGDFLGSAYAIDQLGIDEDEYDFRLHLVRDGALQLPDRRLALRLEKRFRVPADEAALEVVYRLSNPGTTALDLLFCPELNLSLPPSAPAGQRYEFEGILGPGPQLRSSGEVQETAWCALVDESNRLRLELRFEPAAAVWRYPIESPMGSGKTLAVQHQGTAVAPRWELTVPAAATCTLTIRLAIARLDADAVVPLLADDD